MNENKLDLTTLIDFVTEIANQKGNEWFKNDLINNLGGNNYSTFETSAELFIRTLRKTFNKKSRDFYKIISDQRLNIELTADFKEMLWYKTTNNIERQYLFIYYQIENMLNHYIMMNDAFTKISKESDKHIIKFSEKFSVNCKAYFFDNNNQPRELNKIGSIWAKLVFWAVDTKNEIWLIDKKTNFDQIVNLRNDNSHRNSSELNNYVQNTIDILKKSDDGNHSYVITILKKIKSTI